MANIPKLTPAEVRQKSSSLLVCAYEDESKCDRLKINGSLSLSEFRARLGDVSKDELIVFY